MRFVSIFHLLLIAVSSKPILFAFGFSAFLSDLYREDAFQSAGGYREYGTIPFERMVEGWLEHFVDYSIPIVGIAIFPLALLLTIPRSFCLLINRPLSIIPKWISKIHLVVVMLGLVLSVPLSILFWIAAERISIPLGTYSLAHVTGILILGSLFTGDDFETNR